MKKNLATLSILLLVSQIHTIVDETPQFPNLKNIFVGAALGYGSGYVANMVNAQRIMELPGVRHVFDIADEQQKESLRAHLPELGALFGAIAAEHGLDAILKLTKVGALIDLVGRLKSGELTLENAVYMLRDLIWAYKGSVPKIFKTIDPIKEPSDS